MAKRFCLSRKESLKSRKQIDGLFANGKSFMHFPIRVSYRFMPAQGGPVLQIGVTASKRNFKKAVHRNRIKRLLREAYRLQKEDLLWQLKEKEKTGIAFFMYTDKTIAPFETFKESMAKCLKKLGAIAVNEPS